MSKHSFLNRLISEMNNDVDKYSGNTQYISNIFENLLYLGSQASTRNDILIERNIHHLISIGCDPLDVDANIKVFKYEIEDNGNVNNINTFFNQTIPFIHNIINDCINKNQPILIHCKAGMSRSVSVIITWLMFHKNMTYEEAYNYVKERRPVISPNISFVDYMKNIKK